MTSDREHRERLRQDLAQRIGARPEDISDEHLEAVLRILRGMFWNAGTRREVQVLAQRIKKGMQDDGEADRG